LRAVNKLNGVSLPNVLGHKKESRQNKLSSRSESTKTKLKEANGVCKDWQILWHTLWEKKFLNLIFFLVPVAWAAHEYEWGDAWVFCLNFLVMIPMASLLGDFTEEAADTVGETFGGLLNATFGNAVEVVVSIQALRLGQIRVVQSMLLGSVLSNLLLVLGSSFLLGGLKYHVQIFNKDAAQANSGLLLLSALALVVPTPLASYNDVSDQNVLTVSRITAVFLFAIYFQLLYFQLGSHKDFFDGEEEDGGDEESLPAISESDRSISHDFKKQPSAESMEGEHHPMSLPFALGGLALMTLLVSFFSDYLVDSIDGFTKEADLTDTFVGLILLPIVGNVVEHLTAVTMAIKNKMEISMGIAVGSGTQVSVFVIPTVTLFGWLLDEPMNLNFPTFEITMYIMSIIIVAIVISSGTSNWLFGSMLVTMYMLLAVSVFFLKSEDL